MSSEELTQRVLKAIATSKRIPLEQVTIDSEFEQLNIDSMDAVEILFALENEFDINIPDDDVREVRNVRQMVQGVAKLVAAKAAAPGPARGYTATRPAFCPAFCAAYEPVNRHDSVRNHERSCRLPLAGKHSRVAESGRTRRDSVHRGCA